MKLSVSFLAFASVWCFACGEEQCSSTFLRGGGSDSDGETQEQHLQSIFEALEENVVSSIVKDVPIDPQAMA
jgi:hypothetical protein